jgi:hypothetical protein
VTRVIVDPESTSLRESFAVIDSPRRSRKRFPEACVQLVDTAAAAIAEAEGSARRHPALVYGPSVSSEGQRIYYLVRWLDV